MTDTTGRIDQFRQMAEADPQNELGHFSLGRALFDAGQFGEASKSFQRVIALNPNIGKVYHLLAQAQIKEGHQDWAVGTLKSGVQVAQRRGDLMPRNDMLKMLKDLGENTEDLVPTQAPQTAGEGQVVCSRCGLVKPKLPRQPMSNAQGKLIFEKVCADCWREWIGMGTKVINELRLPLNDPQAQKVYDQHMYEFLNLKS